MPNPSLFDLQAYKKKLLEDRKEIDRKLEIVEEMESDPQFRVDMDLHSSKSPPQVAVEVPRESKSFGAVWAGLTRDQESLLGIPYNAHPDFVLLDHGRLSPHRIETKQVSGILSGLSKLCKSAGLKLDDILQSKRKKVGERFPTIYRMRDEARDSFGLHLRANAVEKGSRGRSVRKSPRHPPLRERLREIWPDDGIPRTAKEMLEVYRKAYPDDADIKVQSIRGRLSDLKKDGFLDRIGGTKPYRWVRTAS